MQQFTLMVMNWKYDTFIILCEKTLSMPCYILRHTKTAQIHKDGIIALYNFY